MKFNRQSLTQTFRQEEKKLRLNQARTFDQFDFDALPGNRCSLLRINERENEHKQNREQIKTHALHSHFAIEATLSLVELGRRSSCLKSFGPRKRIEYAMKEQKKLRLFFLVLRPFFWLCLCPVSNELFQLS